MSRLPRLAVGTIEPQGDVQPISWALMNLLRRSGRQVQHFHSRACFAPVDGAKTASGQCSRHLDSWLMSRDLCREIFVRGSQQADVSLVDGSFATCPLAASAGSSLQRLCDWLELPRIAVLDATRLSDCDLPPRPGADALLLDKITGGDEFCRLQTLLEPLWGLPVVGALDQAANLRQLINGLACGTSPSDDLCDELGKRFAAYARTDYLQALADRPGFDEARPQLFRPGHGLSQVRVAVAYDEVFNCYFADTLDLLEMRGASLIDFSPLHDEALPEGTDIVYLGCGHPERYAAELERNHCMKTALREHLCQGRRIYAEGGGLAYLCQHVETPDGQQLQMVGVLPAAALMNPYPTGMHPQEVTLAGDTWLGSSGARLRGYVNSAWLLEPQGQLTSYVADRGCERDVVGNRQALASRMHLNFAAQPDVFRNFVQSTPAKLDCRWV